MKTQTYTYGSYGNNQSLGYLKLSLNTDQGLIPFVALPSNCLLNLQKDFNKNIKELEKTYKQFNLDLISFLSSRAVKDCEKLVYILAHCCLNNSIKVKNIIDENNKVYDFYIPSQFQIKVC